MIALKNRSELELMRVAGKISAQALAVGGELVKPGTTTRQVGDAIHRFILSQHATPSFLGYNGFPASACISVNEQVIHGIPGDYVIREGDIVSIDVGAIYKGYHGDNAATFMAGAVSPDVGRLLAVTRESLFLGIEKACNGGRVGDISAAVQTHVESHGFGIVRRYVGHGIGRKMHEPPEVPNYGMPGHGARLAPGMTLAIEPMVGMGTGDVTELRDGWTVVTLDRKPAAHFEHTVAVTENGPVILTEP